MTYILLDRIVQQSFNEWIPVTAYNISYELILNFIWNPLTEIATTTNRFIRLLFFDYVFSKVQSWPFHTKLSSAILNDY